MLANLSPFVPVSVRHMADKNSDLLSREKERREITVLFLNLEGYTTLSVSRPEAQVTFCTNMIGGTQWIQ